MLNLNSIMVGSAEPKALAEFYARVFGRPADMAEEDWYGWNGKSVFFGIGKHSEVGARAKEPARIILNMETADVKEEFERIKALGATVIKDLYEMHGMWIATFADPNGNYFQLMSPWENDK